VRDPWRVLIIEDDPDVAYVTSRVVEAMPRLAVVGVARSAEQGAAALARVRPDLVLLDLTLQGPADGLAWLRHARAQDAGVEVIVLTASAAASTVRTAMHFGALDYLVKPCTPERLRQALALFLSRASALQAAELDQAAVDRASRRGGARRLPKGLSEGNLAAVRDALAASPAPVTALEVSAAAHMARATAYRYLEYLHANGEVELDARHGAAGRPRKLYRVAS
jgi:response regulator of citrate/malate metabolism